MSTEQPKQATLAELQTMTPEQIVEAQEAGRLDELLGVKQAASPYSLKG